jgi:putative acyl-CoA dehydrogenase
MSDAFLTLAQAKGGLTCFFVPRWTEEGERNGLRFQRLKDKLGNHANASSEVEYVGAWAHRIGEEGRGVRTIIEMVHHTRLDASLANAGLTRAALAQAAHHCAHRSAFGARLLEQPLMRAVLADLTLESEAATLMTMRVARAFDAHQHEGDEREGVLARLAVAVTKFWVCKRTPELVCEALECFGGGGYVEEGPMARLYREAPLNGIWEGSGNVMCLDVLRALQREPRAAQVLMEEVSLARGHHPALDALISSLPTTLQSLASASPTEAQLGARHLTSQLALAFQASLLARFAPHAISEGFCEARLSRSPMIYGALNAQRVELDQVLARLAPITQA